MDNTAVHPRIYYIFGTTVSIIDRVSAFKLIQYIAPALLNKFLKSTFNIRTITLTASFLLLVFN
jgi:hypothetical protein